jgi:hypothetical protein
MRGGWPVQVRTTVPDRYLRPSGTVKDARLNELVYVSATTLKVDLERRLWINPGAVCSTEPDKISPPQVAILRQETGYMVLLDPNLLGRHAWETDAEFIPDRKNGARWLSVVAIVEMTPTP